MLRVLRNLVRRQPELPLESDDSGRFLPWVVGSMVFLAALALAGALAIGATAARWERDLTGTATVQLPALPSVADGPAEARRDAVLQLLRGFPGVLRASVMSREQAASLLEPWLGAVARGAELPMPDLIEIAYEPHGLHVEELRRRIAQLAPGAEFDDHRRWLDGLRLVARALQTLAFAVLLLVGTVAGLAVVFSVRSGLAVHSDVVELLHVIGAQDGFIADSFARHALFVALRGGIIGAAVAVAALLTLRGVGSGLDSALLPDVRLSGADWLLIACLPALAAGLAALTARRTVLSALAKLP